MNHLKQNNICVAYHQGHRKYMEDTLDVQTYKIGGKTVKIYGVFDGHGGDEISKQLVHKQTGIIPFLSKKMQMWVIRKAQSFELMLKETFVEYDKYLLDHGFRKSGSTATMALLWGDRLYLVNAGDSRGMVFLPSTGKVVAVTQDHKPNRPGEAKRIREAGGQVTKVGNDPRQPSRINGILSVSRGFGDFYLKLQKNKMGQVYYPGAFGKVSPVPDVITINMNMLRAQAGPGGAYLLLGSDGLWDHYDGLNPEGLKNLHRFGDQSWCQMLMNFVFLSGQQQKTDLDNITFLIDRL